MDQEEIVFKKILIAQVFVVPQWEPFISVLSRAGICSVNALAVTPDRTIDNFEIPKAPLDLLKDLKQQLKMISERNHITNTFSQPLAENSIIRDFSFTPCFEPVDYIRDIQEMTNKEAQVKMAVEKVNETEIGTLTRHQAIMIALYCQQGTSDQVSFYYLVNRALRERSHDFVFFRPSLYLLDSGLRSLPSTAKITWRGQNYAPDLHKFVVDRIVCFSGLCSTSEDKNATLLFMQKIPAPAVTHSRTLFKLIMVQGYSIRCFSCLPNEKEVVSGFCSRWRVVKVEMNHLEDFGPVGNYRCDVYIELQQLPSENLFDTNRSPLCGLHLLSNIQTSYLPEIPNEFRRQFIDLFTMLGNEDARAIFIERFGDEWNREGNRFRGDITDTQAMKMVMNVLKPLEELRDMLTENGANVNQCLLVC